MKVKLGGKIFILIALGIGAFFLIKHYQASHPSVASTVVVDSVKIDTPKTITTSEGKITNSEPQKTPEKKVEHMSIPSTPAAHLSHKTKKKKDGERENVDLNNY